MNDRFPLVLIVVLVLLYPQLPTTNAFFLFRFRNPCRNSNRFQRCGLFSILMHMGDANTEQCSETCVFLPRLNNNLNCGSCTIIDNDNSSSEYNIYMDLVNITGIGNGTFFEQARDRWQRVITNDLIDINVTTLKLDFIDKIDKLCQPPSIIDDLYICAMYGKMDGRGTILGFAGPTHLRSDTKLPIIGNMKFDIDDIYHLQQNDNFQNVILHEMGHILGIGSLWTITDVTGSRNMNCPYLGTMATSEFRKISNCSRVPVPTEIDFERNGGTFCTHWDEECMRSELMTGFLENRNNRTTHPLSRITIAGLDDLGYTVDYSTADTFTIDDLNENCRCTTPTTTTKSSSTRERQVRDHREPLTNRKRLRSTKIIDTGVHQFGLLPADSSSLLSSQEEMPPPRRRQRRRISEEAYQTVMSYGLNLLKERRNYQQNQNQKVSILNEDSIESSTGSNNNNNVVVPTTIYIGDQVVSILVEDGGEMYGVMVVNDDMMV